MTEITSVGTDVFDCECKHTWYMREEGIQCTKCLLIWNKSMDIKD